MQNKPVDNSMKGMFLGDFKEIVFEKNYSDT